MKKIKFLAVFMAAAMAVTSTMTTAVAPVSASGNGAVTITSALETNVSEKNYKAEVFNIGLDFGSDSTGEWQGIDGNSRYLIADKLSDVPARILNADNFKNLAQDSANIFKDNVLIIVASDEPYCNIFYENASVKLTDGIWEITAERYTPEVLLCALGTNYIGALIPKSDFNNEEVTLSLIDIPLYSAEIFKTPGLPYNGTGEIAVIEKMEDIPDFTINSYYGETSLKDYYRYDGWDYFENSVLVIVPTPSKSGNTQFSNAKVKLYNGEWQFSVDCYMPPLPTADIVTNYLCAFISRDKFNENITLKINDIIPTHYADVYNYKNADGEYKNNVVEVIENFEDIPNLTVYDSLLNERYSSSLFKDNVLVIAYLTDMSSSISYRNTVLKPLPDGTWEISADRYIPTALDWMIGNRIICGFIPKSQYYGLDITLNITDIDETGFVKNYKDVIKSDYPITTKQKVIDDIMVTEPDGTQTAYKGGKVTIYDIHFPYGTPISEVYSAYTLNEDKYNFVFNYAPPAPVYYLSKIILGWIVDDNDNIKVAIYAVADDETVYPPAPIASYDREIMERAFARKTPEKGSVALITPWHGWWDFDYNLIPDSEIVAKINDYRSKIRPATPEDVLYNGQLNPVGIVCFDDKTYLVITSTGENVTTGVMGDSLDNLNQYVFLDDSFRSYFYQTAKAYPNRYYGGSYKDGKLSYDLWYDGNGENDFDLKLNSLSYRGNTVVAKFDVLYDGKDEKEITIDAQIFYSDDCWGGYGKQTYKITGNTTIEFLFNAEDLYSWDFSWLIISSSNIRYNINLFGQLYSEYEYTTKDLIQLAKIVSGRMDISEVLEINDTMYHRYDINKDQKVDSDDLLTMIKVLVGSIKL